MPKKDFAQLEEFDANWMDTIDWADPEVARQQLRDKAVEWAKGANKRLHDLNAGMTKAQERAADWEAFGNDTGNLPILRQWKELKSSIYERGGVDAALEQLRAQQQQQAQANTAKREVQEGVAAVREAYQSGALEWEQAQPILAKLYANEREIDAMLDWYKRTRLEDYKRFEDGLINTQRANLQQMSAIIEPIVDGFDKLQPSERKLRPVLEAMVQKGYRSFDDGYNSLYGAEDAETRIRRELEEGNKKTLAVKEEEIRRKYEQQAPGATAEGGGGDTNMGIWHRSAPKEGRRPDFMQSVLSKLGQTK